MVSAAPAPLRGLRINGNPTAFANSRTWSALSAAVDAAVGTPAARSASFIDGLSRQRYAVRTDVPGMVHVSRTCATGRMCASMVDSSRSTQIWSWIQRTASVIAPTSTTLPTWW